MALTKEQQARYKAEFKRIDRAIEDEHERLAEALAPLHAERDALHEAMAPQREKLEAVHAKIGAEKGTIVKLREERRALAKKMVEDGAK